MCELNSNVILDLCSRQPFDPDVPIFGDIEVDYTEATGWKPGSTWSEDAKKIFLPPKAKVMTKMEELIQNFMLVTEGPQIPAGEVYFEAENPKGALGFYVVSNGGGVPYRLRIRGPSFVSLSILPAIVPGNFLTDVASILGSLDFVMGECDR